MPRLELENVDVSFPVLDEPSLSLRRQFLRRFMRARPEAAHQGPRIVHALENINLTLTEGDRVALIGRNGAGKSTLLRVLAGIYPPTRGTVRRSGRVFSLFDRGFGIDAEATGYENIVIRGLFLGLSPQEIQDRFEDIVAFTELGDSLDRPVRTYSQGMRARLAFAMSTFAQPEILLLDEGLGTGDASFVKKAQERAETMIRGSKILVLASHSEGLLRKFCTHGIWIDQGRIVQRGPIDAVLKQYAEFCNKDKPVPAAPKRVAPKVKPKATETKAG